jgi:hypothetical protein
MDLQSEEGDDRDKDLRYREEDGRKALCMTCRVTRASSHPHCSRLQLTTLL